MILTRHLIFMIIIDFLFVNYTISTYNNDLASAVENAIGAAESAGELSDSTAEIAQCKAILYSRGYGDDGPSEYERNRLPVGEKRNFKWMSAAEALFLLQLDRYGRRGSSGVEGFCRRNWNVVARIKITFDFVRSDPTLDFEFE